MLDLADGNCDWSVEASAEIAPYYGIRHGTSEGLAFFEEFGSTFEVERLEPTAMAGDDEVLTVVAHAIQSSATGMSLQGRGPEDYVLQRKRGHRAGPGLARELISTMGRTVLVVDNSFLPRAGQTSRGRVRRQPLYEKASRHLGHVPKAVTIVQRTR